MFTESIGEEIMSEVPDGEESVNMCKGLEGFAEKSVLRTLTELVQQHFIIS